MSDAVWLSPGEREGAKVLIPKMALYSAVTSKRGSVFDFSSFYYKLSSLFLKNYQDRSSFPTDPKASMNFPVNSPRKPRYSLIK